MSKDREERRLDLYYQQQKELRKALAKDRARCSKDGHLISLRTGLCWACGNPGEAQGRLL